MGDGGGAVGWGCCGGWGVVVVRVLLVHHVVVPRGGLDRGGHAQQLAGHARL